MVDTEERVLSGPQVCQLAGITYRQLDYWARAHGFDGAVQGARGSGSHRQYSVGQARAFTLGGYLASLSVPISVVVRVMRAAQHIPKKDWTGFAVVTRDGGLYRNDKIPKEVRPVWIVDFADFDIDVSMLDVVEASA